MAIRVPGHPQCRELSPNLSPVAEVPWTPAVFAVMVVLPVGVGRPDNRIHAPNENIQAADYLNTVRLMCRVWERFGGG